MYINRTEPRSGTERVSRKSIVNRRSSSEGSFADTMASVIEVDVVEVGDHEEQKRRQPEQKATQDAPDGTKEEKTSLDIKV